MTEYRDAFEAYLKRGEPFSPEHRAMGESGTGSYLVPPEFEQALAVQLKAYGALFSRFTPVRTSDGRTLSYPQAQYAGASTSTTGVLVSENPGSPISENDRVYGGGTMNAWAFSSGVHQVSIPLEEDSAFPVSDVISGFAAEAIGRAMAPYSATGTGSSQPLGVITAANTQGVATLGTTSGGFVALTAAHPVIVNNASASELSSNALAPDTLLKMVQALDPAYYENAAWFVNSAQYAALCQTSTATGESPLVLPNGPRELHGFPIMIANEIPNLAASATGGPVLGDLGAGMYYRSAGFSVRRLDQRYADALQVGYVGFHRCDFEVRDPRAFVTVKPAAT
jgi:HK97 family phage major capsid protein